MNKFLTKHIFWVLQIIGWSIYSVFILSILKVANGWVENALFFIAMFLVGFVPTTILRWLLKRFVKIDTLSIWQFVKVFLFTVLTAFVFKELPYYLGYVVGRAGKYFSQDFSLISERPKDPGNMTYIGIFIILIGWLVFYYGIKFLMNYNKSRVERLKLKDKIRQAQLNTLKGHINPEFMFTSLNNIKGLMLEDVPKSREMLTNLSEMLRYSLTKNGINKVKLEDELEIVTNYIALLGIAKDKKIKVEYSIAPEALKLEIPPMLMINLLEMVTKYGVLQSKNNNGVKLTANLSESSISINVVYDGKINDVKGSQVLEKTIKQRLKLLFKENAKYVRKHELNQTSIIIEHPLLAIKETS